jgi:hypothetical protein
VHFFHCILCLETIHLFFHEVILVMKDNNNNKAKEQKTGQSKNKPNPRASFLFTSALAAATNGMSSRIWIGVEEPGQS